MKCVKCGKVLPDDSEFCLYCGEKIEQESAVLKEPIESTRKKCTKCGMPVPDDSDYCQYCGSIIQPLKEAARKEQMYYQWQHDEPTIKQESASQKSEKNNNGITNNFGDTDVCKTKKLKNCRAKQIIVSVVVAICIITLATLNVLQYKRHQEEEKQLAELKESYSEIYKNYSDQETIILTQKETIEKQSSKLSEKDKEIAQKDQKLKTQKNQISSLEKKADYYTTISSALKYGNIGYAASNFNCSQSIVLVKKGETQKITLTANWNNGGSVTISRSTSAASIDFDQNSWTYSTTLSIKGNSVGISVVTFSNNVNSQQFKIIVIVE